MKAFNVASLLVVMGGVTLTPNVDAQPANALQMASSPVASPGKATPADKKLARDVRKALSQAQTSTCQMYSSKRAAVS
jgi:hypothetical protein